MDHIRVYYNEKDLSREIYIFWYSRNILWLDRYVIEERKTKRHKWNVVQYYDRLSARRFVSNWVELEDVPWTEDIRELAINTFVSAFITETKVKKWEQE